jgi:hypothetical protein
MASRSDVSSFAISFRAVVGSLENEATRIRTRPMSEGLGVVVGVLILLWMAMIITILTGIELEMKGIRKALEKIAGDKDLK